MKNAQEMSTVLVEIAYAEPDQQYLIEVELPDKSTVFEACLAAKLDARCPDWRDRPVGVFSRKVTWDYALEAGDRVEIYRPLTIDPKEARRLRAADLS